MKTTKKIAFEWEHENLTAQWDSSVKDGLVYLTHKEPVGMRGGEQVMSMSVATVRAFRDLLNQVLMDAEGDRVRDAADRSAGARTA